MNTPSLSELLAGLDSIPLEIALTPVGARKQPIRKNWQKETPLSRNDLRSEIERGAAKGYGIRTGEISGGIVALDEDGIAAAQLALTLSNGDNPETVCFSSGKSGRLQRLYRIPEHLWGDVRTRKLNTGEKGDDGKDQHLEFRWNGCQSVLPPSQHPETGKYFYLPGSSFDEVEIALAPTWVIEVMTNSMGASESTTPTLNFKESLPKREYTVEDYIDALNAIPISQHNDYEEWLKIGMACKDAGLSVSDWDGWSQGGDGWKPGVCSKKWDSFKSSGVSAGTLVAIAKQHGWKPSWWVERESSGYVFSGEKRQGKRKRGGREKLDGERKGDRASTPEFDPAAILEAIDEVIKLNLSPDELYLKLLEVQRENAITESQFNKLYASRLERLEKENDLTDIKNEIDEIIKARDNSIDLKDFLPISLASKFFRLGRELNIKPECFLTAMLTATSSLHKVGTKVWLWKSTGFCVSPNLFGAIVAESSQKKSPVIKNIIAKPFKKIREKHRQEFNLAQGEYEKNLAYYKSFKDKEEQFQSFPDGPPKAPKKRQCLFSKATGESIFTQFDSFPDQGMLFLCDELAGLFKSMNQYRNGRGSDEEDLLSLYDGEGATVLRADGTSSLSRNN